MANPISMSIQQIHAPGKYQGIPVLKLDMQHPLESAHHSRPPIKATIQWGSWSSMLFMAKLNDEALEVTFDFASGGKTYMTIQLRNAVVTDAANSGQSQELTFGYQEVEVSREGGSCPSLGRLPTDIPSWTNWSGSFVVSSLLRKAASPGMRSGLPFLRF